MALHPFREKKMKEVDEETRAILLQSTQSNYFVGKNKERFDYPMTVPLLSYDSTRINQQQKRWTHFLQLQLLDIITKNNLDTTQYETWERIARELGDNLTPRQCFAQYFNNCSPFINKGEWTAEEEKNLLILAKKYSNRNWPRIASELGTNRTPVACLRHFQQTLNPQLVREVEWTTEDDERLKEAVEKYGTGKWQHVASELPGRSSQQCLNRWRKSIICQENAVGGTWLADEERALFLAAYAFDVPMLADTKRSTEERERFLNGEEMPKRIKRAPSNWVEIAKFVPGKTDVQCREKWSQNLDPSIEFGPFTSEENDLLIQLVERCGEGNWSQIAEYLPGRTDAMVRSRWKELQKQNQRANSSSSEPKRKRKVKSPSGSLEDHQLETTAKKQRPLPSKHLRSSRAKLDSKEFAAIPVVKESHEI